MMTDNNDTESSQLINQNLSYLIENINDAFYSLDKNWNFTYVNAQAEVIWRKKRNELLTKNIWAIFPDTNKYKKIYEKAIEEKKVTEFEGYHPYLKKWYAVRLFPHNEGLSVLSRDISEQKETQKALSKSNEDLQQFAYLASHDLQEPLRMVTSFMELLKKHYKDKLDDKAWDYINYAVDGAKVMQSLVNDLLIYSRIETRKDRITSYNVEDIIKKSIDSFREEINNSEIDIRYENIPTLNIDINQIYLLFNHLLDNAIKYRDKNKAKTIISIKAEKELTNWKFSVSDNGIGIEEKNFSKIFLPFKRLHSRVSYQGNGIGLAICKKIVERHNGEIWVESMPEHGSKFYFTLPA